MAAEMRNLRAEKKDLKRANGILKSASVVFAATLDRQ
jgi:transposase-like protein